MIEEFVRAFQPYAFPFALFCIVLFSYIGYRVDRSHREKLRAERMSSEVDKYDPEEPVGDMTFCERRSNKER